MLYHKNWKAKRIAKVMKQRELDIRVKRFWCYLPYRQILRKTYPQMAPKKIAELEEKYRILRSQEASDLEKLETKWGAINMWQGRCDLTGQDRCYDKWFAMHRMMTRQGLKQGLFPGWRRSTWN